MLVMGALLVVGLALTVSWGGAAYVEWSTGESPSEVALRYLRGLALALVGGFWTGALVTGPAVRLIMRLLAVTGGDDAQGRITEADEVVGRISFDGTLGLYVFGGLLPGLLSGALYVVLRRWLPAGRLGGVAFGGLHLVVAATRLDPLRPDNPDFDLVGPGWLSVTTFGAACLVHGMAVAAIVNRYSQSFPPRAGLSARSRVLVLLPLAAPALLLIPGAALLIPIGVGLSVTVLASRSPAVVEALRSRTALVAGHVVLVALAVVLLPPTLVDLHDVLVR